MRNRIRFDATLRAAALAVASLSVLGACAKKSDESDGTGGPTAATASPTDAQTMQAAASPDPCSLLQPAEVAAVLGPLAGPPYRGSDEGVAHLGGAACIYETPDFRTLVLEPTWRDGSMALAAVSLPGRMMGNVQGDAKDVKKSILPGGVQIDGEWDEAQSMGCCRIFALRGDSLITFNYEGWKNDTSAAVGLLNKALLRLDKPLTADGNAGVQAALEREKKRPTPRAACTLVSRADVEAILGPLLAEPIESPDGKDCTYKFKSQGEKSSPFAEAPGMAKDLASSVLGGMGGFVSGPVETQISVVWSGGFRQLAQGGMVAGSMQGMMNMPGVTGPPALEPGEGVWSEAAQTSLAFTAVRNDVGVTVGTAMLPADTVKKLRRLVAKVMEKI